MTESVEILCMCQHRQQLYAQFENAFCLSNALCAHWNEWMDGWMCAHCKHSVQKQMLDTVVYFSLVPEYELLWGSLNVSNAMQQNVMQGSE